MTSMNHLSQGLRIMKPREFFATGTAVYNFAHRSNENFEEQPEINALDIEELSVFGTVPRFSGENGLSFTMFLGKLEDAFSLQTPLLTQEQKALRLRFYLSEFAREIFEGLTNDEEKEL